ncbi:AGE family epimerase/isomerase [Deminuibacter soli]|uniref:Cellobiose 2-epimerase n=1 Tax=Deminuibacter soli TaxID=2291815 RepID=A0A3E1NF75_9BACT|nr:AGE family epimerase/isomerase [Deminuibacter soli]RFM26619.1 N-acyl-D-glucosamine 2-epimerase [Deminuibacter soli]
MKVADYSLETAKELEAILGYWMQYTVDETNGGFYGKVNNDNVPAPRAPKGSVLNSRILWSFSAGYNKTRDSRYLDMAHRAFRYIVEHFIDREYGGVYWSVDYTGAPLSDRKQVYGLAFCIYGLTEYYKACNSDEALQLAIALYRTIEAHSYDPERRGYYEAFARNWQPLDDLRLSDKDANEQKTMNTHLHVIEAYANLFLVWPDSLLQQQLIKLLEVFDEYMIDAKNGHLVLFFDEHWQRRSGMFSYGHDIEAAWLLQWVAEVLADKNWIARMKENALRITNAAMEGLDKDGGLWYEYENGHLIQQKHSWPQAEAMIGFLNAWQVSGEQRYFDLSVQSWRFIQQHIKDNAKGEWFWGVNADYTVMQGQDKAGFWKCPYHSSRAMLEVMHRLDNVATG